MTDQLARGEAIQRRVLGEDYARHRASTFSDFNRPLRLLASEVAWGQVWARDGLEPRVRSLLCLAMLTALNRPHELDMHLRGAINNSCTVTEIREAILQTAVYCGFPAAVSAFRQAEAFLLENGHLADGEQANGVRPPRSGDQPSRGGPSNRRRKR
jgi:4-carboxymuconolactone decarboxylase